MVSSFQHWDRYDISSALRRGGYTLTSLARFVGVPENYCRTALTKHCYWGEQAIAYVLDIPVEALWPDRYDSEGRPLNNRTQQIHDSWQGDPSRRLKDHVKKTANMEKVSPDVSGEAA